MSPHISLYSFTFGRLCRDRTFSAEERTIGYSQWMVGCDIDSQQVLLQKYDSTSEPSSLFSFDSETIVRILYKAHQVVALATSSSSNSRPLVFLESHSPPLFEKSSSSILGDSTVRLPSLDERKKMPPVLRCICLVFDTRQGQQTFLKECKELHLPRPTEINVPVVQKNLYSKDNLLQLRRFYQQLCFGLAFEAQKSFFNGILDPLELSITLKEHILQLQRESENNAVAIFQQFTSSLNTPTFVRKRGRHRHADPISSGDSTSLSELLRKIALQYHARLAQTANLFSPSPAIVQSYHLIVTPSSHFLEGPLPDRGNAVLRRFGHHECFLRVSFTDESRSRLYHNVGLTAHGGVGKQYLDMMTDGFRLAGRDWEFLGYSMSGLREHSVWFVNPFHSDDEPHIVMDAAHIRSLLGDFTKLERKPARLAARWSQAFTSTDPSITLESSQIRYIEDRWNDDHSSIFTDGCGTISPALAQEVWSRLQFAHRKSSRLATPSCFQIRLGGAKGVVVQDAKLSEKMICLRPSQVKFDAVESLTLDIAATSSQPSPMFLNRPLIVLLEHHGVKPQHIINLQERAIRHVETSRSSLATAPDLFQQHGLGASFRLPSLFSGILKFLHLDINIDSDRDSDGILNHQLIRECLRSAAAHVLRELKRRARIPVPGSYTLLGVSDEADCLEEGQIYATIKHERTGLYQPVRGQVLITRSPQIHPGDIQFVEAVDHPDLRHLTNVVVFSCRGNRSLPSCLGGGDLDGDTYNLILDPNLFPSTTVAPGDYISLGDKVTRKPCTINDVAGFVLDYMNSDLLGYISILHLRIADRDDPACSTCLRLAELASQAVDFPKTGTAVNFRSVPRMSYNTPRPDFLCPEGLNPDPQKYYASQKVLGMLFRNVPMESLNWPGGEVTSSTDGHKIDQALRSIRLRDLGLPSLQEPSDDLQEEMVYILHHYKEQLFVIGKAHTLSRNPNHHLTEAELVTGAIGSTWGDHRGRQVAMAAMNFQTQELVGAVRRKLRKIDQDVVDVDDEDEGDYDDGDHTRSLRAAVTMARSWAAWLVAEAELQKNPDAFGPQSFGLIALGCLLKIIKEVTVASNFV